MAKLVIKETPETMKNGSAGKVVQSVVGQQNILGKNMLTVMTSDGCGNLEGPYIVAQSDTKIVHDR